jgi:DNA invertase Pin-like site-specific DNA recombinase
MSREYCTIFCRVSTQKQKREGLSLVAQEEYLNQYAKENDLIPLKVFSPNEPASKAIRPKFYGMLEWMNENEVKVLLVEKVDRFLRDPDEDALHACKRIGKEYGLSQIHFPKDNQIWDDKKGWTAGEKLQVRMLSAVAAYKSEIISDEVKKGLEQKVKRGEYPGTPPLGYKSLKKDKELNLPHRIVKDDSAPSVTKLLLTFNGGKYSLKDMESLAKDWGLRSKYSGDFLDKEDIRRILRNKFYYGEFEWTGKVYKNKTSGFEPLITKKTFNENQKILDSHRLRSTGRGKDKQEQFKFAGLLTCGRCGKSFWGEQFDHTTKYKLKDGTVRKKHYTYLPRYHCIKGDWFTADGITNVPKEYVDEKKLKVKEDIKYTTDFMYDKKTDEWKRKEKIWLKKGTKIEKKKCDMPRVPEQIIEQRILEEIDLIQFDREAWEDIKEELFKLEAKAFIKTDIQNMRRELAHNETKQDRLYSDYEKGYIPGKFLEPRIKDLIKRQEEIREKLVELEQALQTYDEKIAKSIEVLDKMKSFRSIYDGLSDEKRKELLKLITIKISVRTIPAKIRDEDFGDFEVNILWNQEVNDLLELGLLKDESIRDRKNFSFNGSKFFYG